MKIKEVTERKTTTYDVITYHCEFCDYTASRAVDVCQHYGREHACKKIETVNGYKLFYFETEEDADAWLTSEKDTYFKHLHWQGEGWYVGEYYETPCPRGCCTDDHFSLNPVSSKINELEENITVIKSDIEALKIYTKD